MVERILFEIKININDLNLFTPRDTPFTGTYTAEVVVDEKNDFEITLKIFFKNEEYLGEKVMAWLNVNDEEILNRIEILKIYQPDNLRGISFKGYNY